MTFKQTDLIRKQRQVDFLSLNELGLTICQITVFLSLKVVKCYFISGPLPNSAIPAAGPYEQPRLPLPPSFGFRHLSLPVFSALSPLSSPVTRSTLHIRSRRRCCLPASREVLSRSREPWLREGAPLHESQASPLHSASPFPPSPQLRMLWALTELCNGG